MSLSPTKQEILETMLLFEKPRKATEIANAANKGFQPTMMHLLGLQKMGFVNSPEKGLYAITPQGKRILGLPEVNKEKAASIIAYQPHDKSFEFYATIGQPLHVHAHSLKDFSNKLERADPLSIEFHAKRGDFEAWFKGLGDEELAKKVMLLKKRYCTGEEFRHQLKHIVEDRYIELATLSGQEIPAEEHNHEHHIH
jgi:predicted transcriptional regulator